MPSGSYDKSTNTFTMGEGSFPAWWAPKSKAPTPCQRTSSLYLTCGCIHSPINHCETCTHVPTKSTQYDAPVENFELCENIETIWSIKDRECNTCKVFRQVYPLAPPPRPNWQKTVPGLQPMTIRMLYEQEIALQKNNAFEAATDAVQQRMSVIKKTWENHVLRLLGQGTLDRQPNVRATEDGIIYDLRFLRQSSGAVKILTRFETVHPPEGEEEQVYSEELVVDLSSAGNTQNQIISPAKERPVSHDKMNCMVCLTNPGWCNSDHHGEPSAPVSQGVGATWMARLGSSPLKL